MIGLTEQEVIQRRARGDGNNVKIDTSRSYWDILRQNLFTFINVVLFVIGLVLILFGLWGDAFVSVGVVAINVVVSVVQEFRAKAKLDRIALLTRPKATVIRNGQECVVDPSEIVLDDLIIAAAGDQIVVDGVMVGEGRMDVDESLLTGESDLITKKAGDELFSGSFCVTGRGVYRATRVGKNSFVNKLTASARQFQVVRTPLQTDINFVVRILVVLSVIVGVLFGASYAIRAVSTVQTVQSAAVIAGLVPAGLILMTTTAYAMGALRMSGKGALIQQSNAVESMSNVNVLCMDKTGTLTANRLHLREIFILDKTYSEAQFKQLMGCYARSISSGNRTTDALLEACEGDPRPVIDEIPFSSARKYSALTFENGTVMLGAPEFLQPYLSPTAELNEEKQRQWAEQGYRVLLVAYSPYHGQLYDANEQPKPPDDLQPLGLLCFSDELRPEVRETLEGFRQAGISLKVISGDDPHTVAALAKQAGFPPDIQVISGTELDRLDQSAWVDAAARITVFGRITPEQKERLVETFKQQGKYVAMIGDGVNDVLSLKKAHIGIAMQSGSAATRGVADIVLLDDSFRALPAAFMEGQRILNGMQDIIRLFLTRAFYAAMIIIGAAVIAEAQLFPFIPKHASLLTLLAVGFPTFALAAWAKPGVPRHNLTYSIVHFVLPAALLLSGAALLIYAVFLMNYYYIPELLTPAQEALGVSISRTALTTGVIFMGLLLIPFVEPPTQAWTGGDEYSGDWRPTIMAVCMLVIYFMIVAIEPLRVFFELERLAFLEYLFIGCVAIIWAILMRMMWRLALFERFLGIELS
ncbi:MAG: haloacid dehalogenase [Phototrophicales bacterium]|nr:MAG: haloacid dehalogenase [Phototrophicales bacterium]